MLKNWKKLLNYWRKNNLIQKIALTLLMVLITTASGSSRLPRKELVKKMETDAGDSSYLAAMTAGLTQWVYGRPDRPLYLSAPDQVAGPVVGEQIELQVVVSQPPQSKVASAVIISAPSDAKGNPSGDDDPDEQLKDPDFAKTISGRTGRRNIPKIGDLPPDESAAAQTKACASTFLAVPGVPDNGEIRVAEKKPAQEVLGLQRIAELIDSIERMSLWEIDVCLQSRGSAKLIDSIKRQSLCQVDGYLRNRLQNPNRRSDQGIMPLALALEIRDQQSECIDWFHAQFIVKILKRYGARL